MERTARTESRPHREAVIDLARARSLQFALVEMGGLLAHYNPESAKAIGWLEATKDLSKAGTPLAEKLADAAKTAAWQGIRVDTTWSEGAGAPVRPSRRATRGR